MLQLCLDRFAGHEEICRSQDLVKLWVFYFWVLQFVRMLHLGFEQGSCRLHQVFSFTPKPHKSLVVTCHQHCISCCHVSTTFQFGPQSSVKQSIQFPFRQKVGPCIFHLFLSGLSSSQSSSHYLSSLHFGSSSLSTNSDPGIGGNP